MSTTTSNIKISADTLNILKNFASINSNLHVRPGNTIATVSPTKTILAEATVAETFENEFGIWDMSKFLSTISLFKDPEFDFEDNHVTIHSAGSKASVKYYYSDPSLLTKADRKINMPTPYVTFDLSESDISSIMRAASVLQAPDMCVEQAKNSDDTYIRVCDKKDPTAHSWSMEVENKSGSNGFRFWFKMENLKMIPGDYRVQLAEKRVSMFEGKTKPLNYWVALDSDSTTKA
jgi:hypothetical protein